MIKQRVENCAWSSQITVDNILASRLTEAAGRVCFITHHHAAKQVVDNREEGADVMNFGRLTDVLQTDIKNQ